MNVLRLKETMLMNKVEFLKKAVFFLVRPETYWVMCYFIHFKRKLFSNDLKLILEKIHLENGVWAEGINCFMFQIAKLFSFTWEMGAFLCKSVHYMQSVSAICSVLTLTAMSVER